jgi:alkylation response protein AidB-like acyl-CoA dehydrogenase
VDLTLTLEQQELRSSARAFLARCCPTSVARRLRAPEADAEAVGLLRAACELGWAGAAVPISLGGGGGNLLDQAVLVEQLGNSLFPTLLASSVSAILAITAAASADQAVQLLPRILDGTSPATVCWPETKATPVRLTAAGGDITVLGDAGLVADAMTAAVLVVPAEEVEGGKTRLALIPTSEPGVHRYRTLTLDGARHARVSLTEVRVGPEHLLLGGVRGSEALVSTALAATALQSVEMVGMASAAFAMTADYVTNRHQFGRPIGDMATSVDAARLSAYQAVSCCTAGRDQARAVAIAKIAANRAARNVTLMAHQLHGGVGYTLEHDLHLFSDRAAAAMLRFGTTDDHLARLGKTMVAAVGARLT